jgi:large repetitive protein
MLRGDVMKALNSLLAVLVLGIASQAAAERDTFYLGDGRDNIRTLTDERIVNTYARVTASLKAGDTKIPISDIAENNFFNPSGFRPGQLVLVLQTQTANLESTSPINLDSPSDRKEGRWEFARLTADTEISGELTLSAGLIQSYDADVTQVVSVPEFTSLHNKGTIKPLAWNSGKNRGGVIVFLVRDTFINDGTISANGAGFLGGQAGNNVCVEDVTILANRGEGLDSNFSDDTGATERLANAGGGGGCINSGGGGGSNYGEGGNGGNAGASTAGEGAIAGGKGGAKLIQGLYPGRLILGGGGGAGYDGSEGARGGGAIFIRAGSLFGNGSIIANGASVPSTSQQTNGGGGGGGGGGTIILRIASSIFECLKLEAKGGSGGDTANSTEYHGPGGGGGGGYIFRQPAGTCTATEEGKMIAGGSAGTATKGGKDPSSHGSQPGTIGKVATALPAGTLQSPGSAEIKSISNSIEMGSNLFVNKRDPTITVTAYEDRSVWLMVDSESTLQGGVTGSLADPKTYKHILNLAEGPHTVRAMTEYQGLWGPPSPAFGFTVDVTGPTVSLDEKPPEITSADNGIFKFSATDNLSDIDGYECSQDGVVYKNCTSAYVYPTRYTGDYAFYVLAKDRAGNKSGISSYQWSVNKNLPVAKITHILGADKTTNAMEAKFWLEVQPHLPSSQVEFYYILNDPTETDLNKFTKLVSGDPQKDGSHKVELTLDTEKYLGKVTLRALARDVTQGLKTPRSDQEEYGWFIDREHPQVDIERGPKEWEKVATASFEFSAPGELEVEGFRCALRDCESPPPTTGEWDCSGEVRDARTFFFLQEGLSEGRNCLSVWARDRAGNESLQPAHHEWQVDMTAPEAPVIDAPTGELKAGSRFPAVAGTAEPFARVLLMLDESTTPSAEASANAEGRWLARIAEPVPDGTHNLSAIARDRAGNDSPETEALTLLVDAGSPPHVTGSGLTCTSASSGNPLLALLALVALRGGGRSRR